MLYSGLWPEGLFSEVESPPSRNNGYEDCGTSIYVEGTRSFGDCLYSDKEISAFSVIELS